MSISDGNNCGKERESTLEKKEYFSEQYFDKKQLYSLANQINDIYSFGIKSMIEIGVGNSFISTFLKKAGVEVKTFDINPNLEPDVCCSIEDVPKYINKHYDLTVCCEVLEHIPFEEFENCVDVISEISENAYITLPNNRKSFGFGGYVRLPKLKHREVSLYFDLKTNGSLGSGHFWEVGSTKHCSADNIKKILLRTYQEVRMKKYSLNPYHIAFECFDSKKYHN